MEMNYKDIRKRKKKKRKNQKECWNKERRKKNLLIE